MVNFKKMVLIPQSEYIRLQNEAKLQYQPSNNTKTTKPSIEEKINERLISSDSSPKTEKEEEGGGEEEEEEEEEEKEEEEEEEEKEEEEEEEKEGKEKEKKGKSEEKKKEQNKIQKKQGKQRSSVLSYLTEKIAEHFPNNKIEKAIFLTKCFLKKNKEALTIDRRTDKIKIGKVSLSLIQFLDFLQLCMSRKKPQLTEPVQTLLASIPKENIPLNCITNPHVRNMLTSQNGVKKENKSRYKGSRAMPPLRKRRDIIWFQSLDDLDRL